MTVQKDFSERVKTGLTSALNTRKFNNKISLGILLGIFITSRIIAYAAGIRFDMHPMYFFWQIIDPELLRNQCLESILYLHNQPPLFNLFIGTILKAFPVLYPTIFQIAYLGWSCCLIISLYFLFRIMKVNEWIAMILLGLFIINPGFLLFENTLNYTCVTTSLLCLATLFLGLFFRNGGYRYLAVFFSCAALVMLIRTTFHCSWILIVTILILTFRTPDWKRFIAAASPLVLVLLWSAKNLVVFGVPACSSWLGMSICQTTVYQLPQSVRTELVNKNLISPVCLLYPFESIDRYQPFMPASDKTGINVLDMEFKSNGCPNFNHRDFLTLSKLYLEDSLYVVMHYPYTLCRSMLFTLANYFQPTSSDPFLSSNKAFIESYVSLYDLVIMGHLESEQRRPDVRTATNIELMKRFRFSCLWLLVVYPTVLVCAGIQLLYGKRLKSQDRAHYYLLFYLVFTIAFVSLASLSLVILDQNRYRFMIDPLYFLLVGWMLDKMLKRFQSRDRKIVDAVIA